jgi:glucosylglycerate synthase
MIYEFAAAYHHSAINRDHLLQALAPLYRARVSSFISENTRAPAAKLDEKFEDLGQEFERQKPYLIDRWNAKAGGER